MKNRRKALITLGEYLTLYLVVAILIFSVISYRQLGPYSKDIQNIEKVNMQIGNGPWESVSLPYVCKDASPDTIISVQATITPKADDCVYVKTKYAQADISLNDKLFMTLGGKDSHPSYIKDTPCAIHLVETYGSNEEMLLQVKYMFPSAHDQFVIYPYILGSSKEIMLHFASSMGPSMILSFVQIIVGCLLLFMSIGLTILDSQGKIFFWLGLFSKFSGIWFLCDNDFSVMCFKNDSLLYMLAYIGFFSFMVPLLHFFKDAISFENPKWISALEWIYLICVIIAFLLQFSGLMQFTKLNYFFFTIMPVTLILTIILIVREYMLYHNTYAKKFILPVVVLTGFSILQAFHYNDPLPFGFSTIFQAGMFIFLFMIGIIAGFNVKDNIELKRREELLEKESKILSIQQEEQKKNSIILAQTEQEMSRQRHDLRHHLTAIQELSQDNIPLQNYLSILMDKVPTKAESYCENTMVNAIVSHYAAQCKQDNIKISVNLVVPKTFNQEKDGNLCVIFSNLLENAVEACKRTEGNRYITIRSSMQHDMIIITMENNFDGKARKINNRFKSSKRDDFGIGLSSVEAIAKKAHGDVEFTFDDKTFHSSVYLLIK